MNSHQIPQTSECKHWKEASPMLGNCGKGHFNGLIVTPNVCSTCADYDGPDRGLGDKVKKVIDKATGGRVKQCGSCGKRRAKLNNIGKK